MKKVQLEGIPRTLKLGATGVVGSGTAYLLFPKLGADGPTAGHVFIGIGIFMMVQICVALGPIIRHHLQMYEIDFELSRHRMSSRDANRHRKNLQRAYYSNTNPLQTSKATRIGSKNRSVKPIPIEGIGSGDRAA
jgi:hypothetical protein